MPIEEEISKILKKLPGPVLALVYAIVITGAAYLFIYFAKALYTLPKDFDLPWLLVFVGIFLAVLVWKRVKAMRSELKPKIS